ncbi:hypothetical protein CALVIDRAFT_338138 [Calocera viscosa TUFC12733]|uniref:Uncharacterized protein n=1 Tax=Calocera viscosa (strain TUFC12733) TaxID=1330018 RepID=A0A167HKH1_CALVF|nr:hypothetical protein CALVIDRAFT_338138 [Calocera viscosa TUFC12733]
MRANTDSPIKSAKSFRAEVDALEGLVDVIEDKERLKKLAKRAGNNKLVADKHGKLMERGQVLQKQFEAELENNGRAARDPGHRQSSPSEVIELSDDDGGAASDQPEGHRHSSPSEVIELSDSSSVDVPIAKQSTPSGKMGANTAGNKRRGNKILPLLSVKELEALVAWKTAHRAEKYDWRKAWASVPSLERMTHDVCRRAYHIVRGHHS